MYGNCSYKYQQVLTLRVHNFKYSCLACTCTHANSIMSFNYLRCDLLLATLFFSHQAVTIGSQQFPRSLIAPLVSILLHESEPPENLTWSCMATLSELGEFGRCEEEGRNEGRGSCLIMFVLIKVYVVFVVFELCLIRFLVCLFLYSLLSKEFLCLDTYTRPQYYDRQY